MWVNSPLQKSFGRESAALFRSTASRASRVARVKTRKPTEKWLLFATHKLLQFIEERFFGRLGWFGLSRAFVRRLLEFVLRDDLR